MVEFSLPVRGESASEASDRASRGRVPEVSLHTAVKGQFGHGTGRAMGKILKKFPRSVVRQDLKTCRGDRRRTISRGERASTLQQSITLTLGFAAVVTLLGILLSLLLAILKPDLLRLPDPRHQHQQEPEEPLRACRPSRLLHTRPITRSHGLLLGTVAPPVAPKMEAKKDLGRTEKKN